MKDKFPGYYSPSQEEFDSLWERGLFVFDTNVLLDFYRYTPKTVNTLLSTFEKIGDRLWIPYHVAYEYHRRLTEVIVAQANEYRNTVEIVKKLQEKFDAPRSHPFLHAKLLRQTTSHLEELIKELEKKEKQIEKLLNENPIKEKLAEILNGKIGGGFNTESLQAIYQEGIDRYAKKIPPGYVDGKNKPVPDGYGDLVIWKEILEKAKTTDEGIIFVTSDTKEDWFLKARGKSISPRPELVEELKKVKDILFYCYDTGAFLNYAKDHLDVEVGSGALKEIKESKSIDFMKLSEEELDSILKKWVYTKGPDGLLKKIAIEDLKEDNISNEDFSPSDVYQSDNSDLESEAEPDSDSDDSN